METETVRLGRIVINYWGNKSFNDLLNLVFLGKKAYTAKSYFYHFNNTELINGCYYGEINKTKLKKFHKELVSKESLDYPLFIIVLSIIILVIYGILLTLFTVSNENMAILFTIPMFFTIYGYSGFINAMITIGYYSTAQNKFKKKNIENSREAK